jgi:NADH-quinone oxidoreductase subunit G
VRRGEQLVAVPYLEAIKELRDEFADHIRRHPAMVWGILSPFLTVEEAYLAAKWLKSQSQQVKLALGPVPVVGEDDNYPKDRRGRSIEPVKFTIRAEKCPNRRGVEEILKHFEGSVIPFAARGEAKAIFLAGGYPDKGTLEAIASNDEMLAVTEIFHGPATSNAMYLFPATAFSEKEGVYVNHAGLAQLSRRACKPLGETRSEGQLYFDLAGRRGLFNAATVRKELAAEIPFFASLANSLDEFGVKLTGT